MTNEALNAALARLDRAVDRIERAATLRDGTGNELAERHVLLQERHGQLRARVQDTIGRLDALIAQGGA